MDILSNTDYKNIAKLVTDSDTQAQVNIEIMAILKKFYKDRLNIIIPKTHKEAIKEESGFFKKILKKIPVVSNIVGGKDSEYQHISLFNDNITTDALDFAITEVPLEIQFLKDVGKCSESESLQEKIYSKIEELSVTIDDMGSSIEDKYLIMSELKNKISRQEAILQKINSLE